MIIYENNFINLKFKSINNEVKPLDFYVQCSNFISKIKNNKI